MKKIKEGRASEIFEYKDDKVVKLLKPNGELWEIEREFINLKKLNTTDLPIPKLFGTITIHNRPGIILERIEGVTLRQFLLSNPWKSFQIATRMAKFHYKIHQTKINGFPSQRENLIYWISKSQIEQTKKDLILKKLEKLPEGDALCHGDFHFNNIIVTPTRYVVLDWRNASLGNSLADVAKTIIILAGKDIKEAMSVKRLLIHPLRLLFNLYYIRTYLKLSGNSMEELRPWILPVAAGFLGGPKNISNKPVRDMVDQLLSEKRDN